MSAEVPDSETEVICPECRRPTRNLKRYQLKAVTFLGFGGGVRYWTVTACPPCMRAAIRANIKVSILSANFLFPFALVVNAGLLLMTLRAGHSPEIAAELDHQAKLRALAASVKGDGSDLDEAKLALLRGDRERAFELAKRASDRVGNNRNDENTKLMFDIYENRI